MTSTLTARLAPLLPARLVAATARAVYPRFEPELARLGELCPPDCGTAVDIGGWYGPWTRRLCGRARPGLHPYRRGWRGGGPVL
ncbi:hypothetical protein ACWDRX_36205, partial [Streptomyces nigra]